MTPKAEHSKPSRKKKPRVGASAGTLVGLPLAERMHLREEFFRNVVIDPRQFLHAFDRVPGLFYFVKDTQSRTILNTREYAQLLSQSSEREIVGKRPSEYLAKELADHYEADDRKVLQTGQPLYNIIEIGFNECGVPDWIITDKYPLRNTSGEIIGIMGTMQSLEGRIQRLPHLGEVGKAAAYIRDHLGERFLLNDVAEHVGVSQRHLQRLFHKLVGLTVQQFVIHSRVHAAAYQLTHSKHSIAETAMMHGFTDQAAFTNTFRKMTGLTPREYRSQHP